MIGASPSVGPKRIKDFKHVPRPLASAGVNRVAVIAPVPPPVTGRTVVTERLVAQLARANVSYTLISTAVSTTGSPFWRKLRRSVYLALYALRVMWGTRGATAAYVTVDANPGTVFTVLYALIARLNRTRILLHHHSHSYVTTPTLAMRCLCRVAGRRALHITPCAEMSAELSARYACIERTAVLSNAFAIDPQLSDVRRTADRPRLVLGHLSNLTVAKGTLTVIECFAELHHRGEPVELHLAGPIQEERVARSIRNAADRFGLAFRYHGPVDGAAKRAFYAGIDVFLFPTTFRNEVQPLVVLEALAAGVPVIAYGRAGIPPLLEGGGGLVVPCDRDFKVAALGQILAWHKQRGGNSLQSIAAARARFFELRERSLTEVAAISAFLNGSELSLAEVGPGRSAGSELEGPALLFIGPLPPPITGRTVATAEVLSRAQECGIPLKLINTAPASLGGPALRRLSRAARSLKACAAVITAPRQVSCAYIAVDADLGMYLTALVALSARLRGLRILLHHHNYSYISRTALRMSFLTLLAGRGAIHINICDAMAVEMRSRYAGVQNTFALSNAISVRGLAPGNRRKSGPLVLGHLSNLTFEKGIATVVNCLRLLRERGLNTKLLIAGPAGEDQVACFLSESSLEFGEALEHMGAVYDDRKKEFFSRIDVFLFPTRYRNETQGIVNLEAMSAGVPVIAYGQCCITSDLEGSGGQVVPCGTEFESIAVPQLACWARDRDLLHRASATARQRFEQLRAQAERDLDFVITLLGGGVATSTASHDRREAITLPLPAAPSSRPRHGSSHDV